ncbi:putative beta-ketoadipyl CoA thiolase [Sinorhizobium fredii NGR234]|uniref:Beta-ketoadipyl CoA thiolase n=1 Tax=Sinorhizobium fredii (strain NBRC 101917 / NGR234) TaxID=394 RepID=C3MH91_SINFN|nr:beta-ketoadipyl CoA thiolase [Sinorhizobium fredii]ACP26377.1 putative beta-ketoadipyl CoA thiolase [Sinorhizobium fredii NGR234]
MSETFGCDALRIRIGGYGKAPFVSPRLKATAGVDSMPETADNVTEDFGVSRADAGVFADDLVPALADEAPHLIPHGGAIAIGHPIGMCGARLVTTAVCQRHRQGWPLRAVHDVHQRRPGHRHHSRARPAEESPCMRKW